jgi:hypothetical protein
VRRERHVEWLRITRAIAGVGQGFQFGEAKSELVVDITLAYVRRRGRSLSAASPH